MSEQRELVDYIEDAGEKFVTIAPSGLVFESEKQYAVQLLNANGYLKQAAVAYPRGLMDAIINVASIGLSLNPAEKLAYLIPRNVKVGNQYQTRIYLEPSYMGLVRLATNSGSVRWVQAKLVMEKDTFMDNGAGREPTHQFNAFSTDRGKCVGAYCVAKTTDGDFLTTTMTVEEINDIMERSESVKQARRKGKDPTGPWVTDWGQQALKTVTRRAYKMWPMTDQRMAQAVDISNQNEGFDAIPETAPPLSQYTAQQKEYFDQLISEDDALGMYTFKRTIPTGVFTSLYNSFEKGTIGRYKAVVKDLEERGLKMFQEYVDELGRFVSNGDDLGVQQAYEEVSPDLWQLLVDEIPEAGEMIQEEESQ